MDLRALELAPGAAVRLPVRTPPVELVIGGQEHRTEPERPELELEVARSLSGLHLRLRGEAVLVGPCVRCLEEARARGQSISALYPATQRPYRAMGYELGGTMTRYEVPLDDLPHGATGPLPVEELDMERDLAGVRACYRASVEGHNGPIDSDEDDWWPDHILGPWFSSRYVFHS